MAGLVVMSPEIGQVLLSLLGSRESLIASPRDDERQVPAPLSVRTQALKMGLGERPRRQGVGHTLGSDATGNSDVINGGEVVSHFFGQLDVLSSVSTHFC
eukprot:CAMPEP_0170481056 /NCGR_PEP_ID=MMETSP0208-20121228/1648_1 /TAXON_ID=197538 /ORGANISM="Strombidium inclinatum, Strain S3" /LENGTH=99 /DNA_ID=CAMNT_0010753693 /DNA_START=259 /DNA_END=555 /DNA_ORIENTATION=+